MHTRTKPDSGAINRYRRKIDNVGGNDSEYDSEGGTTTFRFYRDLGQGRRAKARLFRSDKGTKRVILQPSDPRNVDTAEAKNKADSYKTAYPSRPVNYFEFTAPQLDYRLDVDFFPGNTYEQSNINTPSKFITHYLAAARALRAYHDKGRVIIDLKSDNMLHVASLLDSTTYLIDGGTSRKIGEPLGNTFYVSSDAAKERAKELCWHYAPECWFMRIAPLADVKMDVYALAKTMGAFLPKKSGLIYDSLISPYLQLNPKLRPTLDELEKKLLIFQKIFLVVDEIASISTDFSGFSSRKEISDQSVLLQKQISKLLNSDTFLSNCTLLEMHTLHRDIHDICYKKSQEIKESAQMRINQVNHVNGQNPLTESTRTALRNVAIFSHRDGVNAALGGIQTNKKSVGTFDTRFDCIR